MPASKAQIAVVSTLHHFHEQLTAVYSYDDLKALVKALAPDVIATELTSAELTCREPQSIKREYQNAIYPLLDEIECRAIAFEPPEGPERESIIAAIRDADDRLQRERPAQAEALATLEGEMWDMLFKGWKSALDVNSRETDAVIELKHRFEFKVAPPERKSAWERWNRCFVDRVMSEVESTKETCKVVVLVGLEHSYWLRQAFRDCDKLTVLDSESTDFFKALRQP